MLDTDAVNMRTHTIPFGLEDAMDGSSCYTSGICHQALHQLAFLCYMRHRTKPKGYRNKTENLRQLFTQLNYQRQVDLWLQLYQGE
jgi:hypothetical protein